jgi:hypothetical protein
MKNLIGYEVVYYHKGYRLYAGNKHRFPMKEAAVNYKNYYESHRLGENLIIEDVEYEGEPLNESKLYDGKPIVDMEHYYGLAAHKVGDYFADDVVDMLVNMLPPIRLLQQCTQIGEPISMKKNSDNCFKATYATFKRIAGGIWEYCGECFAGENVAA